MTRPPGKALATPLITTFWGEKWLIYYLGYKMGLQCLNYVKRVFWGLIIFRISNPDCVLSYKPMNIAHGHGDCAITLAYLHPWKGLLVEEMIVVYWLLPSIQKVPRSIPRLRACIFPSFFGRYFFFTLSSCSTGYTSKFLLTGYVGLILHSTAVATTSQSTVEGTMRVLCSYCIATAYAVASQPFVTVVSEYPHRYCDLQ